MTAEPGADAQDSEDAAKGSAKAETSSAATTESESTESDEAAAEGVEIPKQQSVEEAADSEAGEGARK
ncbi:gliding motility protein [Streptomyces phaeochromogenes]|uniref:gliding motility protein n=1 Tax=Streptomyces phaeochromogenes TaxID=1923 RepID=UPI00386A3F17